MASLKLEVTAYTLCQLAVSELVEVVPVSLGMNQVVNICQFVDTHHFQFFHYLGLQHFPPISLWFSVADRPVQVPCILHLNLSFILVEDLHMLHFKSQIVLSLWLMHQFPRLHPISCSCF